MQKHQSGRHGRCYFLFAVELLLLSGWVLPHLACISPEKQNKSKNPDVIKLTCRQMDSAGGFKGAAHPLRLSTLLLCNKGDRTGGNSQHLSIVWCCQWHSTLPGMGIVMLTTHTYQNAASSPLMYLWWVTNVTHILTVTQILTVTVLNCHVFTHTMMPFRLACNTHTLFCFRQWMKNKSDWVFSFLISY